MAPSSLKSPYSPSKETVKVLAVKADHGGCGKYRIEEPARVAIALGVDISVDTEVDVKAYQNSSTSLVEVKEVHTDADCLILQRPLSHASVGIIQQAKRQGIATVVEIDDDFSDISRHNVAYEAMYGNDLSNADWIRKACLEADWVTVSTPALTKYAPHGRVSVLRNYVPESIFEITPRYETTSRVDTVGWTGSTQTHPHDLQETNGQIGKLLGKNNLNFGVVGDGKLVERFLDIPLSADFTTTGWVDLGDYYRTMVETMDVGIVPLERSNFNECKSHLKGIEMAALGIPFVASGTREYQRLEAYGVGKVVKSSGDWLKFIQRWVDRPGDYIRDAKNYRDIVRTEFTYEGHADEWVEAWTRATEHRAKNP